MPIRRCRSNAIPLRVPRYNCDVVRSLRIALCGGLTVERDGDRIEGELAGRQGREVFAYLVLNRRRPVSRDELAAMLWPEQAPRAPGGRLEHHPRAAAPRARA